ncbi:MAG: ATP-dependent Clp protease adaptor ClpS [Bacteroidetes bacterium]|nr:MAG: ATP-dependent Clp protease adaptor ClpS [Bacteroidota bacterium]
MTREKTRHSDSVQSLRTNLRDLVVHNDDFNTFDYVIQTLIEVCKHEPEQAEQCTLIIHHTGKCSVKSGDFSTLKPMYREILNRGITATIE